MWKIPKVKKETEKRGRDEKVYNQVHTDEQVYNQVHTGLNELLGSLNLFYHQCGRDEQVYNQVHTDEQVHNQVHTGLNELLGSLNLFPPPMLKIPKVKKEREKKEVEMSRYIIRYILMSRYILDWMSYMDLWICSTTNVEDTKGERKEKKVKNHTWTMACRTKRWTKK